MAIAYILEVARASPDPGKMLVEVLSQIGCDTCTTALAPSAGPDGRGIVTASEQRFTAVASLISGPEMEFRQADFGTSPTVRVSFRWNKTGSPTDLGRLLLQGVVGLLNASSDDLLFQHDGGTVYLVRRGGRLLVNVRALQPYGPVLIPEPYDDVALTE